MVGFVCGFGAAGRRLCGYWLSARVSFYAVLTAYHLLPTAYYLLNSNEAQVLGSSS